MKCQRCDDEAVAVFEFPEGCACSPEQVQALCAHHAFKATPRGGMLLSNDLTAGQEFTRAWLNGIARRSPHRGSARDSSDRA